MLKLIKFWLPVAVWATIIFSFSNGPVPSASPIFWQDFVAKKIAHMLEYGFFALLLYRAFKGYGASTTKAGTLAVVVAALYGGSDEIHQIFTQGRESNIRDVVFDTIGATLSIYFIWKLLPKMPKRLKTLAKKLDLL